eukprot:3918263-Lingulodinium_polyedra.AAC.1
MGLAAFLDPSPPQQLPSWDQRKTLCLHFDEGSPNLALVNWLLYSVKARVVAVRDIFHREWNDVQLALKSANL